MTPRHVSLGAIAVTVVSGLVGVGALLLPSAPSSVDSGDPEAVTVETTTTLGETTSTTLAPQAPEPAPRGDMTSTTVANDSPEDEPETPAVVTTTTPPSTTVPPSSTTTLPATTSTTFCVYDGTGPPCP